MWVGSSLILPRTRRYKSLARDTGSGARYSPLCVLLVPVPITVSPLNVTLPVLADTLVRPDPLPTNKLPVILPVVLNPPSELNGCVDIVYA